MRCIRCRVESHECICTEDLFARRETEYLSEYRFGDSATIHSFYGFCPLHPWHQPPRNRQTWGWLERVPFVRKVIWSAKTGVPTKYWTPVNAARESVFAQRANNSGRSDFALAIARRLVIGEGRECVKCGLDSQWAKLSLRVHTANHRLIGHIQSLETFVPRTPSAFDGVHWVSNDLAELSGLWGKPWDWKKGDAACSALGRRTRCADGGGLRGRK
jgi:hypothetical protein